MSYKPGGGGGDMYKSTYDSDDDGKVTSAVSSDSTSAVTWTNVSGKPTVFTPDTHTHPQSDITSLVSDLALKAPLTSPVLVTPALGVATATSINGGTLTGNNSGDNATNTQYSGLEASKLNTTAFSGLTKISVGAVAPTSPSVGDLWVDTN